MDIVEIYLDAVWSIKYEGDDQNIFSLRMSQWNDVEYLYQYFERHRKQIESNPFWSGYTMSDMILATRKERNTLIRNFSKYFWNGKNGEHPDFEDKFIMLEKYPADNWAEVRRKMYGKGESPSILRLYAIKVDAEDGGKPAYIITGGGIKLTRRMAEARELQREYTKMISVQNWLNSIGINTKEELYKYEQD